MSSTKVSEISRLSAISQYLQSLGKFNLVSPSIGIPYPKECNEENMIRHRSLLAIQNLRRRKVDDNITKLLNEHKITRFEISNSLEFKNVSVKLKNKVAFLRKKYAPTRNKNKNRFNNRLKVKNIHYIEGLS